MLVVFRASNCINQRLNFSTNSTNSTKPKKPTKILRVGIGSYFLFIATAMAATYEDGKLDIEEISVLSSQAVVDSVTGSRLGLSVMETPATIEIINGSTIRERLDTSVLEAVTRSAGFTNEANPGNGGQSIAARGFRGPGTVTRLFDGTNYYTAAGTQTFPFDTWALNASRS